MYWAMERAEWRMRSAARRLQCSRSAQPANPLSVYFLTGQRFWHQSAFCAWSLQASTGRKIKPHFFDDGSLSQVQRARLSALFPEAVHYGRSDCLLRLESALPRADFPYLHELWHSYPNIRKLIDPHLLGGRWKLVLDSDMLFFSEPSELLQWLDHPQQALHMVDAVQSYGYPSAALEALSGAPLPERVNVGVTGLDSAALDFAELERWCATLIGRYGKHYFLEQALIAAWVGRSGAQVLPAERYRLLAGGDCAPGLGCMDHYVAGAKPVYFGQAWAKCLAQHRS